MEVKIYRKIGFALRPIPALPRGVESQDRESFNEDVREFFASLRFSRNPMEIEDFSLFLDSQLGAMQRRCRLHKRRAELLRSGGAVYKAVALRRGELRRAIEERRGAVVSAVVGALSAIDEAPRGKQRKPTQDEIADRAGDATLAELRAELRAVDSWGTRADDGHDDAKAAERCEELLRAAFDSLIVADDLGIFEPAEKKRGERKSCAV